MKKSNKKGFTIVELVIVIAVIAILAAVLIPTFSGVVEEAKKSAAKQNANGVYKEYMVDNAKNAEEIDYVLVDSVYYDVNDDFEPVSGTAKAGSKYVKEPAGTETWKVETVSSSN